MTGLGLEQLLWCAGTRLLCLVRQLSLSVYVQRCRTLLTSGRAQRRHATAACLTMAMDAEKEPPRQLLDADACAAVPPGSPAAAARPPGPGARAAPALIAAVSRGEPGIRPGE